MAINLSVLKGLFSRLKPAATTIANYGDDVANAVVNYSDDAAKALTTYGDDVARGVELVDSGSLSLASPGLDIRGKRFHWPTDSSPQSQLKVRLMDARSPAAWDVRDISPLPSVMESSMDASQALDNFTELGGFWEGVPSTTGVLGDVRGSIAKESIVPAGIGTSIEIPEIPTSGLVMQNASEYAPGLPGSFGLRPHKNTALGRWFEKQVPYFN